MVADLDTNPAITQLTNPTVALSVSDLTQSASLVKGLLTDNTVDQAKLATLTTQITNQLDSAISGRAAGEKFDDVSTVVSSIT